MGKSLQIAGEIRSVSAELQAKVARLDTRLFTTATLLMVK